MSGVIPSLLCRFSYFFLLKVVSYGALPVCQPPAVSCISAAGYENKCHSGAQNWWFVIKCMLVRILDFVQFLRLKDQVLRVGDSEVRAFFCKCI